MLRKPKKLTAGRLKELLFYEPATGVFTWLVTRGGKHIGDRAGSIMEQGYRIIGIDGEMILASNLAVLYMTGSLPKYEVDHHDLDKANDAWDNLREATPQLNCMNRRVRSDSQSGIKGVQRLVKGWRAKFRNKKIGIFPTAQEAQQAYLSKAEQFAGEFARGE